MKTLKTLLSVVLLFLATSMSASNIIENASVAPAPEAGNSYSRVFVSFNPSNLTAKEEGVSTSMSFPGFSAGYMYGIGVTNNLPLFVEVGGALQYRAFSDSDSDEGEKYEQKINIFSLNIPVNLVYKFYINENWSIDPFFGLDFRVNLTGKNKATYSYGGEEESASVDLFKGEDALKRFQAGWHIGAGATWKKKINFSISYGTDINEIAESARFRTTVISLGYNF